MNMERLYVFLSDKYVIGTVGLILLLTSIWIYVVFTIEDSIYKYIFDVMVGFAVGYLSMEILRVYRYIKGD